MGLKEDSLEKSLYQRLTTGRVLLSTELPSVWEAKTGDQGYGCQGGNCGSEKLQCNGVSEERGEHSGNIPPYSKSDPQHHSHQQTVDVTGEANAYDQVFISSLVGMTPHIGMLQVREWVIL